MSKALENMTPEERLSQAEILLATAAKTINRNSQAIEQNTADIANLRITVVELVDMFAQNMTVIRQMQAEIQNMQSDIRGMQIENQRILRHLFGESEQS
jgi:Fic family protein